MYMYIYLPAMHFDYHSAHHQSCEMPSIHVVASNTIIGYVAVPVGFVLYMLVYPFTVREFLCGSSHGNSCFITFT